MDADERRYWIRNCQGFRVDGPEGRVGVVEDVLYGQDPSEPAALLVRAGLLGLRIEVVPVDAVETIDPKRTRIGLGAGAVE